MFFHAPFPDGGMARLVSAFRFLLLGANNAGVRQKLKTLFLTARRFVILILTEMKGITIGWNYDWQQETGI